jgi:hypothetical protein
MQYVDEYRDPKIAQAVPLRKWAMGSGRVEVHADHRDQSVQRAPFSWYGDSSLCPLVPAVSLGLGTCR